MASAYQRVLFLTLTTASAPTLTEAWETQAGVRKRFMNNRFLSNADAWHRETELTVSASGWHVHDHWLLFLESNDADELAAFGDLAVSRWISSAHRAGVDAHRAGQDSQVRHGVYGEVVYVTKGMMTQKRRSRSHTMGDVLALYRAGDADAAERWQEFEAFLSIRRRWKASSRRPAAVETEDDLSDPSSLASINAAAQAAQAAQHHDAHHGADTASTGKTTPDWWGRWERPGIVPARHDYRRKVSYPGEE